MDIKKLVDLYKDAAYLTMRVRHGRELKRLPFVWMDAMEQYFDEDADHRLTDCLTTDTSDVAFRDVDPQLSALLVNDLDELFGLGTTLRGALPSDEAHDAYERLIAEQADEVRRFFEPGDAPDDAWRARVYEAACFELGRLRYAEARATFVECCPENLSETIDALEKSRVRDVCRIFGYGADADALPGEVRACVERALRDCASGADPYGQAYGV